MTALNDASDVGLVWLVDEQAMERFGRLTVDATAAIIADSEQAADDFRWYRQTWADIQREQDGLTLDASGLDEPTRILVRLLPLSDRATLQKGWLDATRLRHVATAAYGLVTLQDGTDTVQRLQAGRLFQRLHLQATTQQARSSRSTRFQNESTVNPRRTLSPPSPPAVGADPGWTGGGDGPPDRLPHECAWALTTAARRARHTDAVKGERLAWKVAWCARGVDREHAEAGYRRLRVEPYVATAPRHRAAGLDSSAVANRVLPAPSPQQ